MSTIKNRPVLCEAVRLLRKHLGDSQMQFANRLGLHLATIALYETKREPSGQALAELALLAGENGREDLQAAFLAPLAPHSHVMDEVAFKVGPRDVPAYLAFHEVMKMAGHAETRAKVLALMKATVKRYETMMGVSDAKKTKR